MLSINILLGSFQYNVTTSQKDHSFLSGVVCLRSSRYEEAIFHFKLAKTESNGTTPAYAFLAVIYFIGLGTTRNPKKAFNYIRNIRGQYGCRVVNYILGLMYKNGDYVGKCFQSAVAQFAATLKYEWADAHIAEIYQLMSDAGKEGSIDWHVEARRMSKYRAQTLGIESNMQLLYTLIREYEDNTYMYDLKRGANFYLQPFKYIGEKVYELGSKLKCFRPGISI